MARQNAADNTYGKVKHLVPEREAAHAPRARVVHPEERADVKVLRVVHAHDQGVGWQQRQQLGAHCRKRLGALERTRLQPRQRRQVRHDGHIGAHQSVEQRPLRRVHERHTRDHAV